MDKRKNSLNANDRVVKCPDGEEDRGSRDHGGCSDREDLADEVALSTSFPSNCFLVRFCFYRYIPAVVDHTAGLPCQGTFLLHQVLMREPERA